MQANTLHQQINEITERRARADKERQGDKAYMQLRQAQQMSTMVARKKDDIHAKLERLQVCFVVRICSGVTFFNPCAFLQIQFVCVRLV